MNQYSYNTNVESLFATSFVESTLDQIMVIRKNHKQNFKEVIHQALIGRKVVTKYNKGNTYMIGGVRWDKNPKMTFPDVKIESRDISFAQYFKNTYGLEIEDLEQPMITGMLNGVNVPFLLVPELCFPSF